MNTHPNSKPDIELLIKGSYLHHCTVLNMQSSTAGKSPPVQPRIANGVTHTTNTQVNGIQRRETPVVSGPPLAATSSIAVEPGLPTTSEGMEEEEETLKKEEIRDWTNEMSAEAQAHNISMFLSSSASDSGR